jgi:hypothetical protein
LNENEPVVAKGETYRSITKSGLIFFYYIEWKKENKAYFVRFQYGSEKDGKKVLFGDELKSFPSLDKMKKEVKTLQTYCKNLGHTLWQNTADSATTNSSLPTAGS